MDLSSSSPIIVDGSLTVSVEELPKMGLTKLFWRAAVVCYLLGCARPDSIGNFVWQNVATVRALMLMAISDRNYFVPISDMVNPSSSHEFYLKTVKSFKFNGTEIEISCDGLRIVKKGLNVIISFFTF